MKKILALVLSAAICLSMAACGSTSSQSSQGGAGTSGAASTPDTSKDIVNLKWVQVGSGMPNNYAAWKENLDKYLGEKIGVHLDVEVVSWGDWTNRRSVIVNTNEDYDILFTDMGTYASDVKLGAFADISELVKTASPDLFKLVPQDYWNAVKVDGKVYAVPTYKDSSATQYFVWDKELADKHGIDYNSIKELADLTAPLQKIKTEENITPLILDGTNGLSAVYTWYDRMGAGLPAIGVRYNDSARKVVSVFEQDDVMADLTTMHSWFKSGIINADAATLAETPKYRFLQIAQGWSGAAKTTWGPNMDKEAVAVQFRDTVVSNETVQGSMSAISASSKNQAKALEMLQLVNTDSYVRDSLYYGQEGANWEYTADKKVHRINTDWSMAGYTQGTFFNVSQLDDVDFNQWEEVKKLNENAKPSVLLGFSFDTTKVADKLANCVEIFNRYKSELLTGAVDPATLVPSMMKEMRAAGFDEIVAEAQAQIDAAKF